MARPPSAEWYAAERQLPRITEIIRWEYRPGDRLIARVDRTESIDRQQALEIADRIRLQLQLPENAPIVITNTEWSFEVVSGTD